jgi:hypothetical protein
VWRVSAKIDKFSRGKSEGRLEEDFLPTNLMLEMT